MKLKRKLLAVLLVCMCVLCAAAVACAESTPGDLVDLGSVSFVAEGTNDGPVEYTGSEIKPTVKPTTMTHLQENADYIVEYSNNTNVGEATITIIPGPSGTCTGKNTITFQIAPKPLKAGWFSLTPETVTYNGQVQLVANRYDHENLTSEDFTSGGTKSATDAGTYTVTFTGKGNYSGTVSLDWKIVPLDLSTADVKLSNDGRAIYDGTAQELTVYLINGVSTIPTSEYELTYAGDTTNVTTDGVTVTIAAKSNSKNLTGSTTVKYLIHPRVISGATVPLKQSRVTYNGEAQKPQLDDFVVDGIRIPDTDYEVVTEGDITNASKEGVLVTIRPVNSNLSGTTSARYYIEPEDIGKCDVTLDDSKIEPFNWKEQKPEVSVTYNGTPLDDKNYDVEFPTNVTDAGNKTVTITGKGNFTGTVYKDYKIEPRSVGDCKVTLTIDDKEVGTTEYNWTEQQPKVTVSFNDTTLTEKTDYSVTFPTDMTKAEQKQVTVQGFGNFSGIRFAYYEITAKDIRDCSIELDDSDIEDFNWTEQKPTVTVTDDDNGKTLVEGTDYELSFSTDSTGAGEKTVVVRGIGNFIYETNLPYTIPQKDIAECTMTLSIEKTEYNWTEQKPTVTVTDDDNGKTLVVGVDYDVTYPDNMVGAGEKTVKVTGKGNFRGEIEKTYTITQRDISLCTLTLDAAEFTYNGKEQKPGVSVKDGSYELLEGTDYMVSFSNDVTHIGTKTVTVSGMNNFCGSNSADYAIQPKAITITADDQGKLCGIADPTLTATVVGLEDDGFAPVYSVSRFTGEAVGVYAIRVEGEAAQGDYVITYRDGSMYINYAPAPATAPVLDYGTCQNGWYGVKPVRISYPGYTIAKDDEWTVDQSGAHGFQSDISYGDGFVHAVYRLCDASGAVTELMTLDYAQDTTLPSFTVKDENVHVELNATDLPGNGLANGAQVSGAIIRVLFNDKPFDEITVADETGAIVCGATLEKGWTFYQPGTFSIIVEDYAGNSKEVFRRGYADSDHDGLNNSFELNYFHTNPDNPDTDGDGLDDLTEYRKGTDPNAIDTDGDGLTDGEEVEYGFDPRKKDSDDDGVDDLRALLLGKFFGMKDVPVALNLRMDYRQNAVPGAMTNEELAAALDTLTEPGRSYLESLNVEPYQLKGGKVLSRGEETINLQKQNNLQYVKSNNDTSMLYGVYGDSDLLVSYDVKNTAMKPAMGWNLAEIFGSSFDCYSVVASDDAQVIAIAPWDEANDCALADIAVIMPDSGKVWIIKDSKNSKRFDVAPDGTKIAYMNNGEANLLDMVTCNPLDAYKTKADMLAFTEDGGMVVSLEGDEATVCTVVNDELTRGTVTYVGMYDKKQPTQNSLYCGVVLDQETAELYSVEPQFDVYVNGVASSPATLNVLTFRNDGEKYATQYRNFFNQ